MHVDSNGGGPPRPRNKTILSHSDPNLSSSAAGARNDMTSDEFSTRDSSSSAISGEISPYEMSPWNQSGSPYSKSPWTHHFPFPTTYSSSSSSSAAPTTLVGSLIREEGHIYSLAAAGEILYTGSDSKNIRVWKNQKEFSGFKSSSGLVKAIVISTSDNNRIFTGHQDGKIRVWKPAAKNPAVHKRAGSLPRLKDYLKSSFHLAGKRNAIHLKHHDAVSCLGLSVDSTLLYSGSWDRTFKVWRIADSKCLESIAAHDDAVNSVVSGFDDLVFSGSADGTVKVWRREQAGKATHHAAVQTLLKQDSAITALAVSGGMPSLLYCGSSDGVVNFWDGEKQLTHGGVLRGHKLAVLCLAASGSLLLSGSADKTICVWRREGGIHSCLAMMTGHEGPVKCLALVADPETAPGDARWVVYSGSLDKSIKVWKVSELAYDLAMQQHNYSYASSGGASVEGQEGLAGFATLQRSFSQRQGSLSLNNTARY